MVRLLLVAILAVLAFSMAEGCPRGCMCNTGLVRCMHLQMETVPKVNPETVILDLRFNRIREIPPGAFSNLKHLRTLLLNNNHIVSIVNGTFEGLGQLKYLYMYKNRISRIDDDAFAGLESLEHLYLHFNNIATFNKEVFSNLRSLERLFLYSNKIKRIPVGAFDDMPSLRRLRLDSNSLICDCSMLWLLRSISERSNDPKGFEATAACQDPKEMRGLSLNSVGLDDLHCEEPNIVEGPDDAEVTFGGKAVFTCRASGDPEPQILWMKDSNELPPDSRYRILEDGSLTIDNPTDSDTGVFECMAKNPLGEVKSDQARMVLMQNDEPYSAPQFTVLPRSEKVSSKNRTLTLHCMASGKPKPHVSWYRDENRLVLTPQITVMRNGTLRIVDMEASQAGLYRCEAENVHGKISAEAVVDLLVPPNVSLIVTPSNPRIGEALKIICEASGIPLPTISWTKNWMLFEPAGPSLHTIDITLARFTDAGRYACRATNSEGTTEEAANVAITAHIPNAEFEIVAKPYDMDALVGASIEIPCRVATEEHIAQVRHEWRKDGSLLIRTGRHRIALSGSLFITNATVEDGGRYECTVSNSRQRQSASGLLEIHDKATLGPGNRFVKIAFAEAVREVDRAINSTVDALFGNRDVRPNIGELYRIVRFPTAPERQLARAAEIYERTLVNIRRHVETGSTVNTSANFNYKHLLSPDHIALVAELSGCLAHRVMNNCSDNCYNNKYRSFDGTCNNLRHPTWGASNVGFRRILPPIYENGFSQPVGWNRELKYNGYRLPPARTISSKLISTKTITFDARYSHMLMQWGQFLDHDLDHATPSASSQSWDGIDCKRSCDNAAPCFPLDVPEGDTRIKDRRCMDFIRSSSVCGSGMTSVFFEEVQPREQINQLTSYLDASQVYGYNEEIARDLRNLTSDDGLLRVGVTYPGKKPLLPFSSDAQKMDCRGGVLDTDIKCFVAGDIRANEQVGLLAMHTLWFREHNRIAVELKRLNPHWDGDRLYHESRKIVGAEMQHITYAHWLPVILGPGGMNKLYVDKGYDPTMEATIANVFATAALRFGHSLINPVLQRLDENFEETSHGHLPLHKAFFASWRVAEEGGVDPLIRGLFTSPAKLKTPLENLNSDLTEKLFDVAHAVALDLAAINIQRSRDHGIPFYTEWRKYCGMVEVNDFDDLSNEIRDYLVRKKLREVYGSVHNIDVWVGGILENQVSGGKVGPLFECLLVEQFRRIRDGDRFWYENPDMFDLPQLNELKKVSLASIICDNSDNIHEVGEDVFLLPEAQDGLIMCDDVYRMELRPWLDCVDCQDEWCSSSRQRRQQLHIENREAASKLVELREKLTDLEVRLERFAKRCNLNCN